MSRRLHTSILAGCVGILLGAVFLSCPSPPGLSDSAFTVLLSEQLLYKQTFRLDDVVENGAILPVQRSGEHGKTVASLPYQLRTIHGHVYYDFPPGTSILSVPLVGILNLFGIGTLDADGVWRMQNEIRAQSLLAALICALSGCVLFLVARLYLSTVYSIILALGTGLGTQIWSTASKALWSHTWAIFLSALSLFLLLYRERRFTAWLAAVLATTLSWAVFVRPGCALLAVLMGVYVFHKQRKQFFVFAGVALLWVLVLYLYSRFFFHTKVPSYFFPNRILRFGFDGERILGNLVSPSRGLLVYVPVAAWVLYAGIRSFNASGQRSLLLLGFSGIAIYLLVILGRFPHWWGGHCYGARLTMDLVPFLFVIAVAALHVRETEKGKGQPAPRARRIENIVGAVLLVCGIAMNGIGACAPQVWHWNSRPVNVDEQPDRLWDWSDPQFLAPFNMKK